MKLPLNKVDQTIIDDDIWKDMDEYYDEYGRTDHWENVINGGMSWQWYMSISHLPNWTYVVVSKDYKPVSVKNWINENYPECEYKNERTHFLIKDSEVATMVALKWT